MSHRAPCPLDLLKSRNLSGHKVRPEQHTMRQSYTERQTQLSPSVMKEQTPPFPSDLGDDVRWCISKVNGRPYRGPSQCQCLLGSRPSTRINDFQIYQPHIFQTEIYQPDILQAQIKSKQRYHNRDMSSKIIFYSVYILFILYQSKAYK